MLIRLFVAAAVLGGVLWSQGGVLRFEESIPFDSLRRTVGGDNECHMRAKRPDCDPHQRECFDPEKFDPSGICEAGRLVFAKCVNAYCVAANPEDKCILVTEARNYNLCEETGGTIETGCPEDEVRCELVDSTRWNEPGAGVDLFQVAGDDSTHCPNDTNQAVCD